MMTTSPAIRVLRTITLSWLLLLCAGSLSAASPGYKDTLIVAQDGTGDCTRLTDAFELCRAYMDYEVHILVRKGVYEEKVIVPSWLENIVIEGEDVDSTVVVWHDHANIDRMGTFRTYTLRVDGSAITFCHLTIVNDAPPLGQAVALHTEGDRICFVDCRFLGNQDTLFLGRPGARLCFQQCYVEGTTDFIFGASTAWFEGCTIHCKRRSYITAASTPSDRTYGYVFHACRLTFAEGVSDVMLGRPWRPHAATLFLQCDLGTGIHPEGWAPWKVENPAATVRYAEYGCTGTSADTRQRVSWARVLTRREAARVTPRRVLGGWNPIKVNNQ